MNENHQPHAAAGLHAADLAAAAPGPCERDRAIYDAVRLDGRSLESVADEFQLRPRTLRDIVARTEQALARAQREQDRLTTSEARQKHRLRLELLFAEAVTAWHVSKHDQVTQRTKEKELPPDELGERDIQRERTVAQKSREGNKGLLDVARRLSADVAAVEALIEQHQTSEEQKHAPPLTHQQRLAKLMEFFADLEQRAELYVVRRDHARLHDPAGEPLAAPADAGAEGLPAAHMP